MVQKTKTISSTQEEDTPTPKTEATTIAISVQICYKQILDLALQFTQTTSPSHTSPSSPQYSQSKYLRDILPHKHL